MSQALGRGLGSLIPKKNFDSQPGAEASEQVAMSDADRVFYIDPKEISMNPYQPRHNFSEISLRELMDSIKEHGIIQPLVVTRKDGKYELIAGERRWRSATALGLKSVPALVREANEQKKLELALIENLQRQDLDPVETARAYKRLMDEFNLTQEETAKRVGKARSTLANTLRLLELPLEVQEALSSGRITEAHAKYLLGIENQGKQMVLFKKILNQNLSVAQTHDETKRMGGTKSARVVVNYADKDREEKLRTHFGTKARIIRSGRGGRVVLDFYSEEELGNIMDKIEE
ncbi:chromosome partitioning protein ParB [Candidatus Falkowbacteria bacterium HGW-Falkowbacteria-2]|uniref:Chromosome partitioning protein ParB n=1 Tax=Candidatus Falkowbacteria bacterium HGW-Falkowbacteria-2 TaxID=2013769 RepID=A0A2N2E235_9BACT|nr:MAG: chromosome partitioning protein ParB [Candidatus Falkowbacteria bacterium HGW-Falkowbacteria-2]